VSAAPSAATIHLRRGRLYLERALCERYFAGLQALVLLRRDDDLVLMPVRHAAAGGYVLKQRNAAGDRVVDAADFFRQHGIGDAAELTLAVAWKPELAGLNAAGAFRPARPDDALSTTSA
jgi:hypothetical protein